LHYSAASHHQTSDLNRRLQETEGWKISTDSLFPAVFSCSKFFVKEVKFAGIAPQGRISTYEPFISILFRAFGPLRLGVPFLSRLRFGPAICGAASWRCWTTTTSAAIWHCFKAGARSIAYHS
jgi:hypothetical protein